MGEDCACCCSLSVGIVIFILGVAIIDWIKRMQRGKASLVGEHVVVSINYKYYIIPLIAKLVSPPLYIVPTFFLDYGWIQWNWERTGNQVSRAWSTRHNFSERCSKIRRGL